MGKLIILDMYGTLVKADERDRTVRPGLMEFLDNYNDSKKVVFSDEIIEGVEADLQRAGLSGVFDKIYCKDHCVFESFYAAQDEDISSYSLQNKLFREVKLKQCRGNIKNLEQACKDFSIRKSDAVFIADNFYGRDKKSADLNGIRFIRVPQFRHTLPGWQEMERTEGYTEYEDPKNPFSFVSLIGKI